MKNLFSKITDSEIEVMRILWKAKGELPFAEIRKELEESSNWEISTIKTLLRRLCDKGAVLADKREVFYYKPLISKQEYTTQNLIDRLYSGSAKSLVASLLGNKKLNKKDIDELSAMFKAGDDNE